MNQGQKKYNRWFDVPVGLTVILFSFLWVLGYLVPFSQPEAKNAEYPEIESITAEVLNGCGVSGIATEFAQILRANGIDAYNPANASSFGFPKTLLLDRKGQKTVADSVANILNLPENCILIQRNDDMMDITLIIGKDYQQYLQKLKG